jgi:Uma2 family endonuclease
VSVEGVLRENRQILAVSADPSYVPAMSLMTADELLRTPLPDKRVELVRGVLVVREPAGFRHGAVSATLTGLLREHAAAHRLGRVVAAETGFLLATDPDTVRAADVAFVRRERLPDPEPAGYAELAPDLVVEVVSPGDRPGETLTKVGEWLTAGTRLVWVVDPTRRLARVYRQDGSEALLDEGQSLDGEDVIPGFRCLLASICSGE